MSRLFFQRLLGFGRELREVGGLRVGTGQILEFCSSAAWLSPSDVYWVGRATLIGHRDEIQAYDEIFYRYWGQDVSRAGQTRHEVERVRAVAEGEFEEGERGGDADAGSLRASRLELLRHKSFSRLSAEELSELARLISNVRLSVAMRRSRRRETVRRGQPDIRRTIRRAFRTGGEPIEFVRRGAKYRSRRIVFVLDVSGSMAAYSRGLLVFAHAAVRSNARWEAFCFGTRLTRVTHLLKSQDPDEALRRAGDEVNDWDGGTQIGRSVKRFLDDFGHGGLARGAIVVMCSDGLEVGEPRVLEEEMDRLSRLAYRVVWLNPLQEIAGYQPLAYGMQCALPYLDIFASGHNLASLENLAWELGRL